MKQLDLTDGDVIVVAGSFPCLSWGRQYVVHGEGQGKFIHCGNGYHPLDDFEDENRELVGLRSLANGYGAPCD